MSTYHAHHLLGITTRPLGSYLKGLAVLRLIASQADSNARARWSGGYLTLITRLDRDALIDFFADQYAPTPMVAPWNGGSGFYPKDNKAALTAIVDSTAPRFQAFRQAIAAAQDTTEGRDASPKNDEKGALLLDFRNTASAPVLDWLRAAVAINQHADPQYPAILGTGGNDGRFDFTNNLMQRLAIVIDVPTGIATPSGRAQLEAALWGIPKDGLLRAAIGQFFPGQAGGTNASSGPKAYSADAVANPWDFILLLEGAVALPIATVKRLDTAHLPCAAAPFAIRASGEGSISAGTGGEKSRGEQWLPLWSSLATWPEIAALFAESRLRVGTVPAQRALDAARAIARLGMARGIDAFERFEYVERNGQANLAVPLGRWPVRPEPQARLLDDVAEWADQLYRAGTSDRAPAALARITRVVREAMMAICKGGQTQAWRRLVIALGRAEATIVTSANFSAGKYLRPLPPLRAEWIDRLDPSSPVVRVALAIASLDYPPPPSPQVRDMGGLRSHIAPLESPAAWKFARSDERIVLRPHHVWRGRDLVTDLLAVGQRRLIESAIPASAGIALFSRVCLPGAAALAAWTGQVNLDEAAALGRGLVSLRWPQQPPPASAPRLKSSERPVLLSLVQLACLPDSLAKVVGMDKGNVIDGATWRQLCAGRPQAALERIAGRLRQRGIPLKFRWLALPPARVRLALALAMLTPPAAELSSIRSTVSKPHLS